MQAEAVGVGPQKVQGVDHGGRQGLVSDGFARSPREARDEVVRAQIERAPQPASTHHVRRGHEPLRDDGDDPARPGQRIPEGQLARDLRDAPGVPVDQSDRRRIVERGMRAHQHEIGRERLMQSDTANELVDAAVTEGLHDSSASTATTTRNRVPFCLLSNTDVLSLICA